MRYTFDEIGTEVFGLASTGQHQAIEHILLDSRRIQNPAASLFFALKGERRDGHRFIPELYRKGVRSFVVSEQVDEQAYPDASFLHVSDTLDALQHFTAAYRKKFSIPVIGITGSNGKTIVKEWLYQLLQDEYKIVRSPKSYNSQIGVPLSVWGMNEVHTLGIFEAGISQPGEMERLERIIQPTIGILTNIGEAHSEGFSGNQEKLREKLKLFSNSDIIIHNGDDALIVAEINNLGKKHFSWGRVKSNNLQVDSQERMGRETALSLSTHATRFTISVPFLDDASVANALTCIATMLYLGFTPEMITTKIKMLQVVNMRLELKKGINHCLVINDSYSADISSLEMALNFLDQQGGKMKKTVILSDFLQSATPDEQIYASIIDGIQKHQVSRLIGVGERISTALAHFVTQPVEGLTVDLFSSTATYVQQFRSSQFREETILVKGARMFGFEEIVQLLELKQHQTLLEINLNAIVHNLKQYQSRLSPTTKVMGMVKAFAYGSGGAEIAGILEFQKVDYLGVAYVDEGVELRKAGITLPIMVMNPEENTFDALIDYNLEPEIYSFRLLHAFAAFLKREGLQHYPVHIEVETGMNRLGFAPGEIAMLGDEIASGDTFKIQTVFSHLAASEEEKQDDFTMQQFEIFVNAVVLLEQKIGYEFISHICNSAAVVRHPLLQLDMVRLGIGMYGVDSSGTNKYDLQTVATLRSTVAQLKKLSPGDTVSYNRKGVITRDSVIATVRIGYADGYPRKLGHGIGKMLIHGQLAPVIGTVCMDMTMIDVTDIPGVQEGDDVIIFGKELPVHQLAAWAGTIPYEIMTGISGRVKRIYFEE